MARLLAAQVVAAAAHLLDDVAIADLGADEVEPHLLESALQPEVAHHRRHDGPAAEGVAFGHVPGTEGEHGVAVDHLAAFRDEHDPVGVAVDGDAHVGAELPHLGGDAVRRRRAAGLVDVAPVRLDADGKHLGPQLLEDRRPDLVGGAVRAVEHDTQAVQGEIQREGLLQEHDVATARIVDAVGAAQGIGFGTQFLEFAAEDQALDAVFEFVREA